MVLGSPTAKLRTEEAANLFDRGFAMSGGIGTLDSLPPSGSGVAPNMRADVCLRRSAAAIASAEEESMAEPEHLSQGGGRAIVFSAIAAAGQPTHTELSNGQPRFEPVKVFIGPVPGWTGPVLAARATATATATLPANARAYTAEKTTGVDAASANGQEPNAPAVLKRAVRTPRLDRATRPVLHADIERRLGRKAVANRAKAVKTNAKTSAAVTKTAPVSSQ